MLYLGAKILTLRASIHEQFFTSLLRAYRAYAKSLASEKARSMAATKRTSRNIKSRLAVLQSRFHRSRHSLIDEQLFDVTASDQTVARS